MKFTIKRRDILTVLVTLTQAICLCVGMMFFSAWLHRSVKKAMLDQVLGDNILVAGQMSKLIDQMKVGDLRENVDSWSQLQGAIRDLQLPNEGFVCLVDADDESVLCHPALEAHPSGIEVASEDSAMVKPGMSKPGMVKPGMHKPAMVKPGMQKPAMQKKPMNKLAMAKPGMQKPGMQKPAMAKPGMQKSGMVKPEMVKPEMVKPEMVKPEMVKPGMDKPEMAKNDADVQATTGWEKTDKVQGHIENHYGEIQVIAAAFLPELNAYVKVHQKASGIERTVDRLLSPILPLCLAVGFALVGFTTFLITNIMRRYDNRLATINEGLEDLVDQRTSALRKTRDAVVFGLAKLAESRDTDTGEHLDRIRLYVTILAAHLEKVGEQPRGENYITMMALASSLHDIGKVGIPDHVLLKKGGFTPEERKIMEEHVKLGGDCLKAIGKQLGDDDFLQLARDIAYGHHEKWDGSGYPFGFAGTEIPYSARIVALADVYDALRSRRPYKEPMPHEKAKSIILEGRGTHFDPQVVDAFIHCEALFEEVAERYNALPLAEGEPKIATPQQPAIA